MPPFIDKGAMQQFNDPIDIQRPLTVRLSDGVCIGAFESMASPCEVLIDTTDLVLAEQLTTVAAREAWRIEQKYSRYREDGIIPRINHSQGQALEVDEETAILLDFAYQCYDLSDGLFDITSGVLRKVWRFDGSDKLPLQEDIDALKPMLGLDKAQWKTPFFSLPIGMEIDFGGIGKEYAVDRTLKILSTLSDVAILINFGGDIAANKPPHNKPAWCVGVEDHSQSFQPEKPLQSNELVYIQSGGIATSGDAKRFLLKDGQRYGHILNPQTAWPVVGAPHSITVLANTCTEAGLLSTLAMLQGAEAEAFLNDESVQFSIQR